MKMRFSFINFSSSLLAHCCERASEKKEKLIIAASEHQQFFIVLKLNQDYICTPLQFFSFSRARSFVIHSFVVGVHFIGFTVAPAVA
jgi:hypothetical protein